jgi:preprotein translocase subunit SecE
MLKFLKESREELKKVVWPSREEVLNSTIVVLAAVAIISVFLFFVDNAFEWMFDSLIELGTGVRGGS